MRKIILLTLLMTFLLCSCASISDFLFQEKDYQTISMQCGGEDVLFNIPRSWPSYLMLLPKQGYYLCSHLFIIWVYHEKTKSLYGILVFKKCKVISLLRWNPGQSRNEWDWYIFVGKVPIKVDRKVVGRLLERLHKGVDEIRI